MKILRLFIVLFFIPLFIHYDKCLGMAQILNFLWPSKDVQQEQIRSEQPINFSWLFDGEICGMAKPTKIENLRWLAENNVGLVVTLIEQHEGGLDPALFKTVGIEQLILPIPRFAEEKSREMIPTIEQVDSFIKKSREVWKNGKATVVHCYHGEGRTGTILACWLVANKNMNPDEAIRFVRDRRPKSVSLPQQEKFVVDNAQYLASKNNSEKCLCMSEQPRNFSWLIEGKICGMARPTKCEHLKWVEENNVGLVITLTGEGNLPDTLFEGTQLERLYIPIEDYHTPTLEQVDLFISQAAKVIEKGKAVVVHCAGGIGRTGTMLACWLIANENMDPDEAIKLVRTKRPGSIETEPQEEFVRDYFKYFKTK